MKKVIALMLCVLLLCGCGANTVAEATSPQTQDAVPGSQPAPAAFQAPEYDSRFDSEALIRLSDEGIAVNGGGETDAVFTSHDIIYYEDKDAYESGNPYGEGEAHERHTTEEAAAHTVVNITAPGAYRISGKLSAGQIRIDLGDGAYEDPEAVVELILDGVDITCTVAPAILFLNAYECDGNWSADTAKADVDTSAAGANLILAGENTVSGSHVAKIFKDKEGEKKLWKQDGAIYSYRSMNVFGPGSLDLTADNEGLDTELHLTINGGNITICSGNDGINTNEDGVSVTTINGGDLRIIAGLGAEGDGIDSNGYLVINGGTVAASANPAADAGMDSDLGSFIHGGTVIALGSTMDWAESDSRQVTMNLQFAQYQEGTGAITVSREDGTEIFSFDPDAVFGENSRRYMGAILSCPGFIQGETYDVAIGGVKQQYTGTDVFRMSGSFGGFGGQRPEGKIPQMPEGERPEMPADFDPSQMEGNQPRSEGNWEGMTPPEGFDGERPEMPEGEIPTMPEGQTFPGGERPEGAPGRTGTAFIWQIRSTASPVSAQ